MLRRLGVFVALLGIAGASAGCMSQGSQALGAASGCSSYGCRGSSGSQFKSYARQWSRDMQNQQQFVDTYFLNYDVNDPYRCTCPVYDYCP
jgi:hypothetical protein